MHDEPLQRHALQLVGRGREGHFVGERLRGDFSGQGTLSGDGAHWRDLAVVPAAGPQWDDLRVWVVGASHHAWTHPADTIVQKSVADAKAAIQAQVRQWLAVE